MPVSAARTAAFDILLRVEQENSYASELLHSSHCVELASADHGLATELVMGVLRWRSSLDGAIAKVSSQSLERLDPEVLIAVRLGAYQLGWLDRIPARAAIHESVELVKRARKRSAVPFANAVLRKLAQSPGAGPAPLATPGSGAGPNAIATAFAHPAWLVHRWISQFGIDVARGICAYNQSIPATAIRLRLPSAERDLRTEGIELSPGTFLADARRVVSGNLTKTKAYAEGGVAIQDEASQLVAALVGNGSRILDCCAAPGGKTWGIADRNPQATIVAVELHAHRAEVLRKRVRADNVQVIQGDIRELPVGKLFDRVLVDAPCSGTGTIARNPEIKWRLQAEELSNLHSKQLAILEGAVKHVAPGGKLVYSTCSLEREEDENIVDEVLRANPWFRLLDVRSELERLREQREWMAENIGGLVQGSFLRTIPGQQPCDGFFVAVLERQSETQESLPENNVGGSSTVGTLSHLKIHGCSRVHPLAGRRRLRNDDARGRGLSRRCRWRRIR
jgi:16S rRNA (cytosine967-C5)-methyltransferase